MLLKGTQRMKSFFKVALLGLLASLTSAQMTYYFTASNVMRYNSDYEVKLNIHRPLQERELVHVYIKQNNSYPRSPEDSNYVPEKILAEKTVTITQTGTTSVKLKIPAPVTELNSWLVLTSLEINCTGAFQAFHSQALNVESKGLDLYIQSDKAMYKPGDLVRFRTFATDSKLKPFLGKVNITIRDPDRNNLKMWKNLQSDTGIISQTFQLSDQPPLGTWAILIEIESGEEKTYMFKVEEYVLPKFEVSVQMPPFLIHVSDMFRAVVEAKYTFGKAVKGNASIAVGLMADGYRCREAWQEASNGWRVVPVCKRVKILTELNKDGKYDVEIPITQLKDLLPYTVCNYRGEECNITRENLKYQTFYVWVNVTETATGVVLSGQDSIIISGSPAQLMFLPATPNNYKPGLPFIGYVQLSQPDQSPLPEADLKMASGKRKTVNLTIEYRCPYIYRQPLPYPPVRGSAGTSNGAPGSLGPSPLKEDPNINGTANSTTAGTTITTTTPTPTTTPTTTQGTTVAPCTPYSVSKPIEVSPGGIMAFEVPVVSKEFESVILKAEFETKYDISVSGSKYISPFETKSNKGLRVLTEMADGALKPGTTAIFEVTGGENISRLQYDIIAKGEIVYSQVKVYDAPAKKQSFSLVITEDFARLLAPSPRIVVWYVRDDGEVIADSVSFSVESKLANQVNVKFSTNETKPGMDMTLMVEAYQGSAVGVLVVDQSVKLLASGNDITKDMVEGNLRQYNPNTPFYPALFARGGRWGGFCCGCWPYQMSGSDTAELFDSSGYVLFTDAMIYKKPQPTYGVFPMARGERGDAGPMFESALAGRAGAVPAPAPAPSARGVPDTNSLQPVERVRTEFPETWIWLDTTVGPDGRLSHQAKAPDTITSWVASAFALSKEKGLGVSSPAEMTVFKPFFVSLTLPYALIRGEQFSLKATVFNYLSDAQDVTVTLDKSIYYDVLVDGQEVSRTAKQTIKVPANDAQTVVFWIIPTKVGQMNVLVRAQSSQASDALRRIIPVRPEGTPQEHTESMLISMAQRSSPFVKVFKPNFPPKDVVEDSQRVKVTVIGDIMGPMVNNLNNFVKMPYGCGEQNMVNFVPNIQVLRYIDAAGLNMPEIRDNALRYMESGYQRELTYKRGDGSFSAFGERDPYGSTWLTAFVLKSFAQAVPYMDVSEKHIEDAARFLVNQQARDGSFAQPGRTASYLAGGSGKDANMVAYIAIALATAKNANYSNVEFKDKIKKIVDIPLVAATKFLEGNMTEIQSDTYSMALTTYLFILLGHPLKAASLEKLNKMGFEKSGMKYWANEPEQEEDYNQPWWHNRYTTKTYDIEMTSYAMLANLHEAAADKSLPTLKWLTKKRNSLGGYYSTQDTVMALQALTQFATLAVGETGKQKMYVRVSADIQDLEFDPITSENSMIMQIREIPRDVSSLTIMGTGSGAAMVQMTMNYNIRDPDPSKDLKVVVDSMEDVKSGKVKVDVCFQWVRKGKESGMGILEITPLSGFEIDTETLLQDYPAIRRHERNGQTLVTYWDKFEEKETCLNVTLLKAVDVSNLQEAEVKIYSYYQPEMSQTLLYLPKNLKQVDPCIACPNCCKKDGIEVLEKIPIEETNDKEQTEHEYVDRPRDRTNAVLPGSRAVQGNGNAASTLVPSIFVAAVLAAYAILR